jgi:predicted metal-dependent HD superfamily phosphohydrolase
MEVFISICDERKISSKTSREWLDKITQEYSGENRHFHNVALIEKKLSLIKEIIDQDELMDALVLATLFQYFHYDVKNDLKKENCDEFKLFINQTGIKDVSLVGFVTAWMVQLQVLFRKLL